jgi:glycosyltransferase involved in cell wall biosynthesis
MRVAIITPWYVANGGAEKVDGILGEMFPQADIFSIFYKKCGIPAKLRGREIAGSFLNKIPFIDRVYRPLLSIFPYAIESFDLRAYDLVISSDWAVVKGVLTGTNTRHICYCHSPMQHIWDRYREYMEELPTWKRPLYASVAKQLRQFDFQGAQRVDSFIANSRYIARRIQHHYRRDATVIYPPVETSHGYIAERVDDYYLSVGRLNRTKRLDLLVQACNRLQRRLVISGWGPEEKKLKALAGPTIEFIGRAPDSQLPGLYANCRALLFAANEDFGIVPVEAQSYGRPVIAYGYGGSLETVRVGDPHLRGDTGVFFAHQTVESVVDGILQFEAREESFVPEVIKGHAASFDTSVFRDKMRAFIDRSVLSHSGEYECRA